MALAPTELRRLSQRLDEALDLDPAARGAWLAALEAEDAALARTMRELLAHHPAPAPAPAPAPSPATDTAAAGRETADFAARAPHPPHTPHTAHTPHTPHEPREPPVPAPRALAERRDLLQRGPAFTLPAAEAPGADGGPQAGERIGPYRLERELGRGGMGSVWLAERADGALKRRVALKLPHLGWAPGLAERFAREREILATLEHPHIARLYDAGIDGRGRPWMALEFVEGEPIDAYARRLGLDTPARLKLLLQVADAVAFAHGRLVLHRDLKPANLLVTAEGQVRLLDFGIAKLMEGERAEATALTQLSGRAMTLDYASPEQIRGEPLSTASDVYALGVVAYELLTGERPYRLKRGSAAELEEAILAAEIAPASTRVADGPLRQRLRGDLDAVLAQALQKDPARRYRTADAMAADIRHHLAGESVSARAESALSRGARWLSRHRLPVAAAGGVGAAFALAVGVGATAVVIAALAIGLGAALWQARAAAAARDRAVAMAERTEAGKAFLETLLMRAARGGSFTARQLIERSEQLLAADAGALPDHRAFVLGQAADLYSAVDDASAAVALLDRALAAAAKGRDPVLRDSLTLRRAVAVAMLGRTDEAQSVIDALLARPRLDPAVRWEALWRRAHVAQYVGDFPGVRRWATAAYEAWQALPSRPRQAEPSLLADLGWAALKTGRPIEAEAHYARSEALFAALGLADSAEAVAQGARQAHAFQEMGDAREALRIVDARIAVSRRALPDVEPSLYLQANRAFMLVQLGEFDAAEAGFRHCAEQALASGQRLLRYNVRMLIADLECQRGRTDAARREIDAAEAERDFELPEGGPAQFAFQLAEARLALGEGRPGRAIEVFDQALESRHVAAGTANALLGRSEAHRIAGALDAGEADAREALAIAQTLKGRRPSSFRLGLAHLALAKVLHDRGAIAAAADSAARAVAELEAQVAPSHPRLAEARGLAKAGGGAAVLP